MKKSASGNDNLLNLLNSGANLWRVDLFKFVLLDGTTIYLTTADVDLQYDGNTYYCNRILIDTRNSHLTQSVGINVDTMDLTLYATINDLLPSGLPVLISMQQNLWDFAYCYQHKAYSATPFNTNTALSADYVIENWFVGLITIDQITRSGAKLKINSLPFLLNIKMPRNVCQPGCLNNVFDSVCGLNRASYTITDAASTGSTTSRINCGLTQTDGWFDQGTIVFTSGNNDGYKRTVKSYTAGVINLLTPLYNTPEVGDTFEIVPGCHRDRGTCLNKFNNLANFRGMPFVPKPEQAL